MQDILKDITYRKSFTTLKLTTLGAEEEVEKKLNLVCIISLVFHFNKWVLSQGYS